MIHSIHFVIGNKKINDSAQIIKMLRPKQDNDKMLKTLREIVASGGNRQCFDCGQRGVTYVNMTVGSFVCTSCSGVL